MDAFTSDNFIQHDQQQHTRDFSNSAEGLLKATAANVRELILVRLESDHVISMRSVVSSIQELAKQGNPLPTMINIFTLYPPMPFGRFAFGHSSTSPLIQLWHNRFKI